MREIRESTPVRVLVGLSFQSSFFFLIRKIVASTLVPTQVVESFGLSVLALREKNEREKNKKSQREMLSFFDS